MYLKNVSLGQILCFRMRENKIQREMACLNSDRAGTASSQSPALYPGPVLMEEEKYQQMGEEEILEVSLRRLLNLQLLWVTRD